jgi:hypothetical protein
MAPPLAVESRPTFDLNSGKGPDGLDALPMPRSLWHLLVQRTAGPGRIEHGDRKLRSS